MQVGVHTFSPYYCHVTNLFCGQGFFLGGVGEIYGYS